ncbi:MAG: hypothetical protein KDH84_16255, partial [Calditrichaeota bacterium]|nr:hypothetical protein [Calditrichota bacterium]
EQTWKRVEQLFAHERVNAVSILKLFAHFKTLLVVGCWLLVVGYWSLAKTACCQQPTPTTNNQ